MLFIWVWGLGTNKFLDGRNAYLRLALNLRWQDILIKPQTTLSWPPRVVSNNSPIHNFKAGPHSFLGKISLAICLHWTIWKSTRRLSIINILYEMLRHILVRPFSKRHLRNKDAAWFVVFTFRLMPSTVVVIVLCWRDLAPSRMNLLYDQWAFHLYVNGIIILFPGSIRLNSNAKTATSHTFPESTSSLGIICLFLSDRYLRAQSWFVNYALLLWICSNKSYCILLSARGTHSEWLWASHLSLLCGVILPTLLRHENPIHFPLSGRLVKLLLIVNDAVADQRWLALCQTLGITLIGPYIRLLI